MGTEREAPRPGTGRCRLPDAATPADAPGERDHAVDALGALAILALVLGEWLATALVEDGFRLHADSPLHVVPQLAPASWALPTAAVLFLVGGHAATRSYAAAHARGEPYRQWLSSRLLRLRWPVVALLTCWAPAATVLLATGTGLATVRTLLTQALSPLCLLGAYAVLTAATPLLIRLSPLWPLAVVLHVDLLRFGYGAPPWLGWVNAVAGWMVPYTLGAAWTRGEVERRRAGWILLAGGAVVTAVLLRAGCPATTAGVPGDPVSPLAPPTLAAVTFGLAQCGLALLLRERLRRAMRRPRTRAVVTAVNLSAATLFLWHRTALQATGAIGLLAGRLPGLHTVPDGPERLLARLAWLPASAAVLAACCAVLHFRFRVRNGPSGSAPGRRQRPAPPEALPRTRYGTGSEKAER